MYQQPCRDTGNKKEQITFRVKKYIFKTILGNYKETRVTKKLDSKPIDPPPPLNFQLYITQN